MSPALDLVVHDALIIDGRGAPAYRGSLGVADGRIAAIAETGLTAARTIDAAGRVLAPGFVDLHTHSDFTLPRHPHAAAMLRQGVTTQVVGNCGFSPFPVDERWADELRAATAWLDAGLDWGAWNDAARFMTYLDGQAPACNVAVLIGHGAVRTAVMGSADREPTPAELDEMRGHVAGAMRAGAVGMSCGLTYAPGVYAGAGELAALAAVVAEHGGFTSSHMRSEASGLLEAIDEIIEVGAASGSAVQISHLKALGATNWPLVDDALARIDAAVDAGRDVLADQYPYTAGSTTLAVHVPAWARSLGTAGMQEHLRNPADRARIREQIHAQRPEDLDAGLRPFDPDTIRVAQVPPGLDRSVEGLSLTEIADRQGAAPVDALLDLVEQGGGGVLATVHTLSEERVRQVMRHPAVAVASDGWTQDPAAGGRPHPRSYGTFVRVLGHYVRETGVLGLEEAVRKMTSLPASRLPGCDVGVLSVGSRADLVVFDPETVADTATFAEPHAFAQGVSHVVVAGEPVVADGVQTDARPGGVLRAASRR